MDYIYKYWYIVIIAIILLGYSAFDTPSDIIFKDDQDKTWTDSNPDTKNDMTSNEIEIEKIEPLTLFVDIKGEVISPGVYEVKQHSRVIDVIQLAGGFTEFAERKGVNLAEKVVDEMVIYVSPIGEELTNWTTLHSSSNRENRVVNINFAKKDELEKLPGIGPSKANAIISYREKHGHFKSIDDLEKVSGIGSKLVEKFREYITIK